MTKTVQTGHQRRHPPHRTRRREGAAVHRQLPVLRGQGPLRRHGVPPRHQGLHDPGRWLRAGHEAEAHRRADPERGQQRPEEQALHAGHGAHQRPAFGHGAVLHQHRRQRLPRLQAPSAQGWGYAVFGKVVQGHGGGRQPSRRCAPAARASTTTCRWKTCASSGPPRWPDAATRRPWAAPRRCRAFFECGAGLEPSTSSPTCTCARPAAHLRCLRRLPASARRPTRCSSWVTCSRSGSATTPAPPFRARCVDVLAEAASQRTPGLHGGNRDFLVGSEMLRDRHDGPARPHRADAWGSGCC
jgi:hypothetical protein